MADVLDNIVNTANNVNSNNSADVSTSTSAPVLTPEQQGVANTVNALPEQLQTANQAIGQAGQIEQSTAPGIGQATQNLKNVQNTDASLNASDLKRAQQQVNNLLTESQSKLDSVQQQLQINPQQAVQQQYFGTPTKAIFSGLAMAIGGAGAAVAHQDSGALGIYNQAVQSAKDLRAQNIEGYLNSAKSAQAMAELNMTTAEKSALARNISEIETNHALNGIIQGSSAYASAQGAPQKAQILQLQNTQNTSQAGANILNIMAAKGALSDHRKLDAFGQVIGNYNFGQPTSVNQQTSQLQQGGNSNQPQNIPGISEMPAQSNSQQTAPAKKTFLEKLQEKATNNGSSGGSQLQNNILSGLMGG